MSRPTLDRRTLLKSAALSALGWTAGSACAGRGSASEFLSPGPKGVRPLARVRVSPDRVIRTITGLRPYRPSGFVVRVEQRDDKVLIHNYGHGGGGVTLSWGTAHLVAEQAHQTGRSNAAVIGCGAVGLATARLLQRRGWRVAIYARDLPPETTSNIAGAQWSPFSIFADDRITPEFQRSYVRAAHLAYREFQLLAGPTYGVRWLENYFLHRRPIQPAGGLALEVADLSPDTVDLAPGEHPFPVPYVRRTMAMLVEPSVYLNAMLRDFLLAGGLLTVRELGAADEIMRLPEPVIVNCTGLDAKRLFGDDEMIPVKGQLCFLPPQPEVDYMLTSEDFLYMFPRQDGILLGGSYEKYVSDLSPSAAISERILAGHAKLFGGK